LSARLLLLAIIFVIFAEILFYIPSIAYFRKSWLEERLAAAQIAALALSASSNHMVSDNLTRELLANAGVKAVVLKRGDNRRLILSEDIHLEVMKRYDLRHESPPELMMDAAQTLFHDQDKLIQVTGAAKKNAGEYVQIILDEAPLIQAMQDHTRNILLLSLIISVLVACLIYISLLWMLVRPIARMTEEVIAFRDTPEDEATVMTPSDRSDEIGVVQRELCRMQDAIRTALRQKSHLASLGAAVAKINHDLRNILASAHLISNRLTDSQDPTVKNLAPRLIKALDRAVSLCENTLQYGKPEEIAAKRQNFKLRDTLDEVALSLGFSGTSPDGRGINQAPHAKPVAWHNNIPDDLEINADPEHIFRIILNICRNAHQSMESIIPPSGRHEIIVDASSVKGRIMIDIRDSGPGLPNAARQHLFKPFLGSARSGSAGLGLAIAKELAEINGGAIELLASDALGTTFRLYLPAALYNKKRATG
jgi:signal transduction histidine kinase